ncbi:MAG TPA: hypothetical protein VEG44_05110 [Candidatus Acidoferrales bacterium]|nr:hypothetical protein [Candidatus Acidoferrales bacterium]
MLELFGSVVGTLFSIPSSILGALLSIPSLIFATLSNASLFNILTGSTT